MSEGWGGDDRVDDQERRLALDHATHTALVTVDAALEGAVEPLDAAEHAGLAREQPRMGGLALKRSHLGNGGLQSIGQLERSGSRHGILQKVSR